MRTIEIRAEEHETADEAYQWAAASEEVAIKVGALNLTTRQSEIDRLEDARACFSFIVDSGTEHDYRLFFVPSRD